MRIALVHRDLHAVTRGGVCTIYRSLAAELCARGHQVTLITQQSPTPLPGSGADVVSLPRTDDLEAHQRAVLHVLDGCKPDVAECSSWEYELLAYARRPRSQRAAVVVRGDLSAYTQGARHLVDGERALIDAADAAIAVSRFARGDLLSAYGRACTVVLNGVDRSRFTARARAALPRSGSRLLLSHCGQTLSAQDLPRLLRRDPALARRFFGPPRLTGDEPVRLVWVGKMTTMKGWDRFQRIARRLRGHATVLVVLGHGQVHYPVTISAEPHVLICRDLDDADMAGVYAAGDYLLSTSRWEGFGLAIAEALACGTPALLPANLGVAAELIEAGVSGATYRDDDELVRLVTTRPRLTGRLHERFGWSANASATVHLYRQLTGAHGAGRAVVGGG